MKHILIIPSEHYITREMPLAGIFQGHLVDLLQEFGIRTGVISAGFIPFSYSFKPYPYTSVEKKAEVSIYRSYFRTFIPGRFALKLLWPLLVRRYFKLFESYLKSEGRPDLIHAHNCLFAGVVAKKIKEVYGVPFVITEHSSMYERGFIDVKQKQLAREVFINADAKTTVSTALGAVLSEKLGIEIQPLESIYNVLETGVFSSVIQNKSKRNFFAFLTVGSLDSNKNQGLLIDAFALSFARNLEYRLSIGGSGELRTQLEKQVQLLGINNQVEFLGHLTREEVKKQMNSCDAFVLSSNVETFGVVLIEALSTGKPIITTNCGGPRDIVNELNGVLVPVGDKEALASAMVNMAKSISKYDPDMMKADCIQRFGRDAFFERIEGIYARIIN
jgi:glycosyltransferase involved in cell wall biosynthesis